MKDYTMKDLYKMASSIARYIALTASGYSLNNPRAPKNHYFITIDYNYIINMYLVKIKGNTYFIVSSSKDFDNHFSRFNGNGVIID